MYATEYHKARAWTNQSFYVIRFLPQRVTELALLYLGYIRPFTCMLYAHGREVKNDAGYLFCSDKSLEKSWDGTVLSDMLQQESTARLGWKLGIWAFRHILIGITKVHIKEIAGYFLKKSMIAEIAGYFLKSSTIAKDVLQENADIDLYIYAWQAGHQREINVGVYGKDAAYPTRMQPELLYQFLRISRRWHHFFESYVASEESAAVEKETLDESSGRGTKRKMVDCATQMTPSKKRKTVDYATQVTPTKKQKTVDCATQTTPKEVSRADAFMNEIDSPETKKWKRKMIDAARMIQLRKSRKN
jgi:hypothetical protein